MAGAYDFFAIISDFPTFHTYIDSIILVQTEQNLFIMKQGNKISQ